jgi:hypothetical protein
LRLGHLLGRVTTPIVLGIVYVSTVVPLAVLARAVGRDVLRLRRDPQASSYWIPRDPPGPDPASLANPY